MCVRVCVGGWEVMVVVMCVCACHPSRRVCVRVGWGGLGWGGGTQTQLAAKDVGSHGGAAQAAQRSPGTEHSTLTRAVATPRPPRPLPRPCPRLAALRPGQPPRRVAPPVPPPPQQPPPAGPRRPLPPPLPSTGWPAWAVPREQSVPPRLLPPPPRRLPLCPGCVATAALQSRLGLRQGRRAAQAGSGASCKGPGWDRSGEEYKPACGHH